MEAAKPLTVNRSNSHVRGRVVAVETEGMMGLGVRNFMRPALLVSIIGGAVICLGQQSPPRKLDIGLLLTQLHSDEWKVRAEAYRQLGSDHTVLSVPNVKEALLNLLDREDQLTESTLRDSHEQMGVSGKYGEEFAEYVAELGETVDSFANWNDPRQVCVLVNQSYNPGSKFAAEIASHAVVAVPCLLSMYKHDEGLTRAEAAAVLVQSLAKAGNQLDSRMIVMVRQVIVTALRDPSDAVRSSTVRALGKFGGPDMIPALLQVAASDPSPEYQGHSIRREAADAIAEIGKRVNK